MSRNLRKKPPMSYVEFEEPSLDEYVWAGLGVFATLTLPIGVRFGPYRGKRADDVSSSYCWQMYDRHGRRAHVIDAADARRSNWMRYVNCSRHWCEQNLVAFQYRGQLYYRTIKIIPRFTELMVFYGTEFAQELGVDIRAYNSPPGYARKYGAPAKKSAKATDTKALTEASSKPVAPELIQAKTRDCDTNMDNQQKREEKTEEPKAKKPKKSTNTKFIQPLKKTNEILNEPNNNKKIEVLKRSNDHSSNVTSAPVVKKAKYTQPITTFTPKYIDADKLEPNTENINVQVGENLLLNDLLCEICNYKARSKKSLENHLILHTQDKNILKCSHCGYMSKNKSTFTEHLKSHTEEKPFYCRFCDYACMRKRNLESHLRTHTGEKRFSCNVCNYKCARKFSLEDHLKNHTGEKPLACKVCNYKCIQTSQMKRHVKTHTGERPFACKVCKHRSRFNYTLKRHMRARHSDEAQH